MARRWELAVVLLVLAPSLAHAWEREPRVLVRFAPPIAQPDAARLLSAMRAQLRETAVIDLEAGPAPPACVVDVDRTEAGIVLRFTDGAGRTAGAPRIVSRRGEIGASEVATIVRAFVVAATESAPETPNQDETKSPNESANEAPDVPDATWHVPVPQPRPESVDRGGSAAPSSDAWRARIAAFYTGATYAAELPWHSGARFEGAYAFVPGGLYGGITYAFHPATDMMTEAAPVRISRHAGALFLGLEGARRTLGIGADAAVGLEALTRSTSAEVESSDGVRVVPVFAVRVHGRWRIPYGRGVVLDFAPTLEVAPWQNDVVVERQGTSTRTVPTMARLRLDVGATFDLF